MESWVTKVCLAVALGAATVLGQEGELREKPEKPQKSAKAERFERLQKSPEYAFAAAASERWEMALADRPSREAEAELEAEAEAEPEDSDVDSDQPDTPTCEAGRLELAAMAVAHPHWVETAAEYAAADVAVGIAEAALADDAEITIGDVFDGVRVLEATLSEQPKLAREPLKRLVGSWFERAVTEFAARELMTAARRAKAAAWAERIEPWARNLAGDPLDPSAISVSVWGDVSDGGLGIENRSGRDLVAVVLRMESGLAAFAAGEGPCAVHVFVPRWPEGATLTVGPELAARALAQEAISTFDPTVELTLWSPEGRLEGHRLELPLHGYHCAIAERANSVAVELVPAFDGGPARRAALRGAWGGGDQEAAIAALEDLRAGYPLEPVFVLLLAEALGSNGEGFNKRGAARSYQDFFASLVPSVPDPREAEALLLSMRALGTPLYGLEDTAVLELADAHMREMGERYPKRLLACPTPRGLRAYIDRLQRQDVARNEKMLAAKRASAQRVIDKIQNMKVSVRRVPPSSRFPIGVEIVWPPEMSDEIGLQKNLLDRFEGELRKILARLEEVRAEAAVYERRLAELQQ